MDDTLPLPSSPQESNAEAKDLKAAISQCFTEMDSLREQMHRSDSAIVESGERTDSLLAEIAETLAAMKAA